MGTTYPLLALHVTYYQNEKIKLVSSTTPLGQCMRYSIAPKSRLGYIQKYTPDGINTNNLIATFKRDLIVDIIVERLSNVDLYYIESRQGRGDELYYFLTNNRLFHGERVWSAFHPFALHLHKIPPSAEIAATSWFVGSRNNYTHQIVDFLPNLIYRMYSSDTYIDTSCINVFGSPNSILRSVAELPLMRNSLDQPSIYLGNYGKPVEYGAWQIRCIRFRELHLIRHLSIFKAFSLLNMICSQHHQHTSEAVIPPRTQNLLYLRRPDSRVINQSQIIDFLTDSFQSTILGDIHKLSLLDKQSVISRFSHIVLPPGSDNINALCFSNPQSVLFQMIPVKTEQMLNSPFTSYASLRYLLPFLHRLVFLPCDTSCQTANINSGKWSIDQLRDCIMSYVPTPGFLSEAST